MADGEIFHRLNYVAASKTLPFGTILEVCYRTCTTVRIADHGPYILGRALDLSEGAAKAIGLKAKGVAPVRVTVLYCPRPGGACQSQLVRDSVQGSRASRHR